MQIGNNKCAHVRLILVFFRLFFRLWEAEAMRLPSAILHLEPERDP